MTARTRGRGDHRCRPREHAGGRTRPHLPRAGLPRTCLIGMASVLMLLVAACTPTQVERPSEPEAEPAVIAWPDPAPSRPLVDLSFTVAEDLASAEGTERITFTPDLDICELVFRLWPNKPMTADYDNALEVTEVLVDQQVVEPQVVPAGAPEGRPGTLLEVPLPSCITAGTEVTAELEFALVLGEGTNERVGVSPNGEVAWFGTAFPLLAWENGRGWAREPAVPVSGEMATSETFHLRSLEVVAPTRYDVLGIGVFEGSSEQPERGTTTHRFTAPAVRDVTVTVGLLDVLTREAGDARLHVGVPRRGVQASPSRWATQVERSIEKIVDHLGPLPYPDIWVSVLPDQTSGIEFPGAMQFGNVSPEDQAWLVTHEVAHMWFYGLVGNNQGRDPWLDEAFATFVQLVVDDQEVNDASAGSPELRNEVGRPMSYWTRFDQPSSAYVEGVYLEGGAALLEARERAGAEAFDAALTGYLLDHAHRIAVPADVEAALAELPAAVQVLRRAGALVDEDATEGVSEHRTGSPNTAGRPGHGLRSTMLTTAPSTRPPPSARSIDPGGSRTAVRSWPAPDRRRAPGAQRSRAASSRRCWTRTTSTRWSPCRRGPGVRTGTGRSGPRADPY
jgi:hypothetical protein